MSYHTFKTDKYIIFKKSHNIILKSEKLRFYYGILRKIFILKFETLKILENKLWGQKLDTSGFPSGYQVLKTKLYTNLNKFYKIRS